MKSALLYLILAVCITSWNKVMPLYEIPQVVIPAETHSCPIAKLHNESLQLIRNYVSSSLVNYSAIEYCGKGLWHRIAYLNMTDPLQQCPSNWREYHDIASEVRACGRFGRGCPGVFYRVSHQYSRVCGQIIGYQVASPGAFHIIYTTPPEDINDIYVNGISVTYGSPRKHIWTLAAGVTEGTHQYPQADCPCAVSDPSSRRPAPDYVGNNYYCESGNLNPTGGWINLMVICTVKIHFGMESSVKVSAAAMESLHHGSVWSWLALQQKILRYGYVEIKIYMTRILQ